MQRMSQVNHFKTILYALQWYDDAQGHLPAPFTTDADGQPACSWRYVTKPFWEAGSVGELPRLDLPWNAPANAPWVPLQMDTLCFLPNTCTTSIAAVTGQGTAFDTDRQHKLKELPNDIILVVEVRDFGVHWMQPGDLDVGDLARSPHSADTTRQLFGTAKESFIVGFADSEVWVLANSLPLGELMKFFTIEGAQRYDRDAVLRPYRLPPW